MHTDPIEEWRPCSDWPAYSVSSFGRIRRDVPGQRAATWVGRILRATNVPRRYTQICLTRPGCKRTVQVHHLVAAAFLGPRPDGMQINHIDGNKHNNVASNLEYLTPLGNAQHAVAHGLYRSGEAKVEAKLTWERVDIIRRSNRTAVSLAREFGVSAGAVRHARTGLSWVRR